MIIRSIQERRERRTQAGNDHRIANRLRRYFAPSSTLPPPGSTRGLIGNRNVTQTSQNSPNNTPTDAAIIQLVPGSPVATAVWTFKTKFTNPPVVSAIALTTSLTGNPQEITVAGQLNKGDSGVTLQSSDPGDERFLHVTATGTS